MFMQSIVSITSQGQLTIPQKMRKSFGITGQTKAIIEKKGEIITVRPQKDFWSLSGSLQSDVKLSDSQLKKVRRAFSEQWSKNE